MLKLIAERLSQRGATVRFPEHAAAMLPAAYRGRPQISDAPCAAECAACADACPTNAIVIRDGAVSLDLGCCLFCGECARVCPQEKIAFTNDYRMAARRRADLIVRAGQPFVLAIPHEDDRFRRSFRLRQVSAGGSGAEEAEINVLQTVVFDMARWGIQLVASPRHGDAVVVTGPVTRAMKAALQITYDAMPAPKLVIAVGVSAISGGPWLGGNEGTKERRNEETKERRNEETNGAQAEGEEAAVLGGVNRLLDVDLFIPGFPPHPLTILDGLLRLIGRI